MAESTIYYSKNTWNLARGIASTAIDLSEQTVDTPADSIAIGDFYTELTDVYQQQEAENDVWPFDGPMDLLGLVDEHLGLDSDSREMNDLAKAISTRVQEDPQYEHRADPAGEAESPDGENSDTDGENGSEFDESVQAIAEQLYHCFVAHDVDSTYRELQQEYDSAFPKRSVALTEVANSKGETEVDRINNIAEWGRRVVQ